MKRVEELTLKLLDGLITEEESQELERLVAADEQERLDLLLLERQVGGG